MRRSVLVATSVTHRQLWYESVLNSLGMQVHAADTGLECLERIRNDKPDLLILETYLLWGGVDGVLTLCNEEDLLKTMSIIVIDVGHDSGQTYRLGVFPIANYWKRYPTVIEISRAINAIHSTLVAQL